MKKKYKVIISGGGTGGHIFPALSIAGALTRRTDVEILFAGALGRMEMEKVPAAGYNIIGLPVQGFNRKKLWRNLSVVIKAIKSMTLAKKIIKDFKPDIAIGVGGYASGPMLKAAQAAGIPTLIQEQNSYAGVTNKMLARHADRICTAYEGMERFFPEEKIILTGNPVRKEILDTSLSAEKAREKFGLRPDRPTILAVGGSLGARTINEALASGLDAFGEAGVQLIWQTGKYFGDRGETIAKGKKGVVVTKFITDMSAAYAAADIVISRAGAGSISELELLGKPSILIPSPNVAEDHQTKNALALSEKGAAILIPDHEARNRLVTAALDLVGNKDKLSDMKKNISRLAQTNSDEKIVDEIIKIIEQRQ